jgi:hypothetical protein
LLIRGQAIDREREQPRTHHRERLTRDGARNLSVELALEQLHLAQISLMSFVLGLRPKIIVRKIRIERAARTARTSFSIQNATKAPTSILPDGNSGAPSS